MASGKSFGLPRFTEALMALHLIDHPLVAHYLTRLRDRDTTPDEFREASDKIITLLLYEATRTLR
ncbi:MAG TPA: uracil phosphoribosyltransferase, partial [Candidatus Eisenbacteria bacterium]|nr:uracil phosphoribosyltransferase [Candidatus Eisenbacteria bacterium]